MACVWLLGALPLHAAEAIEFELWCDLHPSVQEQDQASPDRLTTEEALRRLLEEARSVVSGMVYGYSFVYTPSDEARKVPERFDLSARALIEWGDSRLHVAGTRVEGEQLRALFRYELSADQTAWREAWNSGVVARTAGAGTGNLFLGYRERSTALSNALMESIRGYLRPIVPNKPREVSGEVLLWEGPSTYVRAGEYHTRVVARVRIRDVLPYRLY